MHPFHHTSAAATGPILGIETSCDETAVALYDAQAGLLGEAVYSQTETHARWGGVVPELASRDHIRKLGPMVAELLQRHDLSGQQLGGVAYTAGPGLIGALLVGAAVAHGLAAGWSVPVLAIHHLEGHLLAPLLDADPPAFPFIALLVSGGHTMLVEVAAVGHYQVLGETMDDAVGEAFDKTAKLLGLPYPGGPQLARLAEDGDATRFQLPRPLAGRNTLDFSFSGLKTAVRVQLERAGVMDTRMRADMARCFEERAVECLARNCRKALEQTGLATLIVAGGVGANQRLRKQLQLLGAEMAVRVCFPAPAHCTDNAAMIALAGHLRRSQGQPAGDISAQARWPLQQLGGLS